MSTTYDRMRTMLPNGWEVEKEKGQYCVRQMRGAEWVRATWVDSPVLTMFFDDLVRPTAPPAGPRPEKADDPNRNG